jgi:hypothetical protein
VSGPWSPGEEARIVAEAVEYIQARIDLHRYDFAMQVGEHLFTGLFKGDMALYRYAGPWKERAVTRIAQDPRVGLELDTLYMCIHAYLAVRTYEKTTDVPLPALSPWKWGRICVPLVDDPEALVEVALWIEREKVPRGLLRSVAQLAGPYVEAGGRLEDLLVARKRASSPYRMMRRMLGVVDRKIASGGLPDSVRARTLEIIARLLEAL